MSSKKLRITLTAILILALTVASLSGCAFARKASQPPDQAPPAKDQASLPKGQAPASGQQPAPGNQVSSGFPVVLKDGLGREVKLEKRPERIISLAPSNTEILFALGAGDRVVGVTDNDDYPAEVTRKDKIGGAFDVKVTNLEKIVALKPDLLVAIVGQKTVLDELQKLGLTFFAVKAESMEEILDSIKAVGRLTGQEAEGDRLVKEMRARLDAVSSRVQGLAEKERPRVFNEVWFDQGKGEVMTSGPGSFMDEMIRLAGGINVASDAKAAWASYSMEALIKKDPDVILTPFKESVDDLKAGNRNGWQGLKAVKEGRVVLLDQNLISRPGPRIVEGLEQMARGIHPNLFK